MEDEDDSPAQPSREATLARFLSQLQLYRQLVVKYWWIPAACVTLALLIQWLLLAHSPKLYVSTGRMIVNAKLSLPNANVYSEELNYFFGTQVALMQSDSVINRVNLRLRSSGLNPSPVSIEVVLTPKTSIYNLRAAGRNSAYTQAYLQATMEEYIKLKRDLLSNATTATQSGMEEELRQMGAELAKSKEALLNYQASNSVVFLQPNGGNAAAEYLSSLNRQLAERNSELLMLKTLTLDENLERLREMAVQQSAAATNASAETVAGVTPHKTASEASTPATLGGFEEAYLQVKQDLVFLKARRDEVSKYLVPEAKDLVNLNKEIARQEKLLDIYRQQSEEQLRNRQHTLELQVQDLTDQVKEWEKKALDVSKKLSDYEVLKENQRRLQSMYDQMLANLQTLDVNKGIGQESVTILEPATPARAVSAETAKHLLMALLIGSMLGFGVILCMTLINDRPNSFKELEQLFDLPVLGQIPEMTSNTGWMSPILQAEDERYPLIESYRSLRSALIYKDAVKGLSANHPRTIVVTSAVPGDGKSTTSANLAITLAQSGARVLLIDADLRRGRQHEFFSVSASPGLAEAFTGACPWAEAVVQTDVPNLSLLPCGTPPRRAGNLFANPAKLIAEMAGSYDYYIFDSAPVMMADDVLSLAPHADGVMLVVRAGYTSSRVAKASLEALRQRRVNVVGLVFNSVHRKNRDYYNYRSEEYYPEKLPV